ncbi:MAG: phage terminase large subunit [Bdellovibrionota bacterium]
MPFQLPTHPQGYESPLEAIRTLPEHEMDHFMRELALQDLYFLLRYVLQRGDVWNPPDPKDGSGKPLWLGGDLSDFQGHRRELEARRERWGKWCFERCREIQEAPDGRIDLWARGHYKSTIITFALTIQEILKNPEIRIGIFSQDNPTAESHLVQIKREFENNHLLRRLFRNVLHERPETESPLWSQQKGIVVKREKNPKEPTLSSYGLVDGLPVGPHFDLLVYDDTVTRDSVRTPEQIKKTTEAWEHSLGLRAAGARVRYIGTRYHLSDTYQEILRRGVAVPRIYPAEKDRAPALLSRGELEEARQGMGATTYASQMMQDPRADTAFGFKREWLAKTRYGSRPEELCRGLNVYLTVDPASSKKPNSDYTAMLAIGLGQDRNYYLLDAVRDRLSLRQRGDALFELHRKWRPLAVGYEQYGAQADIEHVQEKMERENYRFPIRQLGGKLSKEDRIRRLNPLFEHGRVWLPGALHKTDCEGKVRDLVQVFIEEEYAAFPAGSHDDLLDALARILDEELGARFPGGGVEREHRKVIPLGRGWMGR